MTGGITPASCRPPAAWYFKATLRGIFIAYDAATGKKLKDIDVGSTIIAAPMSYEIDGVQYIAVMAAWGGGGWSYVRIRKTPRTSAATKGGSSCSNWMEARRRFLRCFRPSSRFRSLRRRPASADVVKHGGALFGARCAVCHVNQPRSEAPDLRRMAPETHDAFNQIVLGGILKSAGMPPWEGVLTQADVDAIHAYLISLSWDAYNKQQAARQELNRGRIRTCAALEPRFSG